MFPLAPLSPAWLREATLRFTIGLQFKTADLQSCLKRRPHACLARMVGPEISGPTSRCPGISIATRYAVSAVTFRCLAGTRLSGVTAPGFDQTPEGETGSFLIGKSGDTGQSALWWLLPWSGGLVSQRSSIATRAFNRVCTGCIVSPLLPISLADTPLSVPAETY